MYQILGTRVLPFVNGSTVPTNVTVISKPEDLPSEMKLLLRLRNAAGGKPIKKFRDLVAAKKTVWALLPILSARRPGKRPSPMFTGRELVRAVKANPCRENTRRWRLWETFTDGQTYEAYLAKGGNRSDLAVMVTRGHILVQRRPQ